MIRLEPFKFALSNTDLTTSARWQAAVDAEDFLFCLELPSVPQSGSTQVTAHLYDRNVDIEIARPTVSEIVATHHPALAREWAYGFAARGTGSIETSIAAAMLTQAIARATNGVLYDSTRGVFRELNRLKRGADTLLAAVFDRADLLRSRYPEVDFNERDDGPTKVASRISRY